MTEKLLTNSQQQKKALMQQLLTGKKRLLDENGVRFSGEWEKGKFCDMANIDTGYAFKSKDFTQSDSGIPIIRMSDFKTGGLDVLGAAKVDRDSVNGLDKFKLRVGDFVFGMSGSLNNYGRVEKKTSLATSISESEEFWQKNAQIRHSLLICIYQIQYNSQYLIKLLVQPN